MASKVYYMNDRSSSIETSLVAKMLTVFDAAGLGELIKPGDMVAIKMHCGEYNNTAYLRPVYPRALADKIKSLGGRPFVTDTTTLPYSPYASRNTALDYLLTAERNGFTPAALGCPLIVADGFMGKDDICIDLPEGYVLKEQYVARAIALADVAIVLTHFKGHGGGVIGGSIKNIGIGAASQRGKYCVHLGGHPKLSARAFGHYNPHLCLGRAECPNWELCQSICPYELIHVQENTVEIDMAKCPGCLACNFVMGCGVIAQPDERSDATCAAIADSALACMKAVGRDRMGFINMAIDIAPSCDCVNWSDRSFIPNLGVFASRDPVAIDRACVDKSLLMQGIPGSAADDRGVLAPGFDKFPVVASARSSSEDIQINTGNLNGLGSKEYELIEVASQPRDKHVFEWDRRPIGTRQARRYAKDPVFPAEGFRRIESPDIEKVR